MYQIPPPTGMIRREHLLNIILAIWKTRYGLAERTDDDQLREYGLGFEEALDAFAQALGLQEYFDAEKSYLQSKKLRSTQLGLLDDEK